MTALSAVDVFVSTEWLADQLDNPEVIAVDASWYMPQQGRNPAAEFVASHIAGAVFFDIDKVADPATGLPHMLPLPEKFAEAVGALGISEDMTVVIYDEAGLMSAPRAWWTFRAMGAKDVRILSGGGPKWRAEGRPLASGPPSRPARSFTTSFNPDLFVGFDVVNQRRNDGLTTIVDARPADRFLGQVPEPRPGLRGGHIPGSLNVPVGQLTEQGRMKPAEELRALFADRGIDTASPIITSCGSGITAATLALALVLAGAEKIAIYDGSWADWGSRPDAAIDQEPRVVDFTVD